MANGVLVLALVLSSAKVDFSEPVVDIAGALDPAVESALAQKLTLHRQQTGVPVGVLVLDTISGGTIADAGRAAADRFHEGFGKGSEGVVIVIAQADKKFGIHVDPGLRGQFNDAEVAAAIEQTRAKFREGDVTSGAVTLAEITMFEVKQRASSIGARRRAVMIAVAAGAIIVLVIIGSVVMRKSRSRRTT